MSEHKKKPMDTIEKTKLRNAIRNNLPAKAAGIIVAVAVGIAGFSLIHSKASGFFVAIETESGRLGGNAQLVSDASASGGKAIQFNAPATTTPPPTTPPPSSRPDPFPTNMKPDATNTGLLGSTILTVINGDQIFGANYNGQTISNKDFHGYVKVSGSNITFSNCIFRGGTPSGNAALVDFQNDGKPGMGNIIEDSEMVPTIPAATIDGIWAQNVTILRVNLHDTTDGIKASSNTTIRDSYIHDLQYFSADPNQPDGTHNDGVQILDGTNIVVRHDNLYPGNAQANSSVQITQDFGVTGTVLLDSNWADWGGCTFNVAPKPLASLNGVSITNNRFGRHQFYTGCALKVYPGATLAANSGNVWDDNGQPIPPPQ